MHISLHSGKIGARIFRVSICVDDQTPNQLAAIANARIECTCPDFAEGKPCRHVRAAEAHFYQWQSAQTRLATRALLGNSSLENLTNTIATRLGISLAETTFIPLPGGEIALQWHPGTTQPASTTCGWGTGSQEVYISRAWPEVGALHLMLEDSNTLIWEWALQRSLYFPHTFPALPPALPLQNARQPIREPKSIPKGTGAGLLDLLGEEHPEKKAQSIPEPNCPDDWARFWAAMLGVQLVGRGWRGEGSYLPEWQVREQPVGGLAFNLARGQVKAIPAAEIAGYSAGVPSPYHTQVGHVHLAWGREPSEDLAYQFIVRHPDEPSMKRTEDVLVLGANFWDDPAAPSLERQAGLGCIAAYLQRMGHDPGVRVRHGSWYQRLGELAGTAPVAETGGVFDLRPQAWEFLEHDVLPRVLLGDKLDHNGLAQLDLGPDWPQMLPPTQE